MSTARSSRRFSVSAKIGEDQRLENRKWPPRLDAAAGL
jgi:hypothetical protein